MNKKLIFRILGAVASALIIASVFVPFVSVTGYSSSLWEANNLSHTLYLPIMIICFGAIGVIFFSLNIKTEFAYTTSGGTIFFVLMETISIIDQNTFNTLSIGYYFLCIGSIITGLMAFLCNLKPKFIQASKPIEISPIETTVLNQIDKLYKNESNQEVVNPIQIDNNIQPIPVAQLEQNNNQPIDDISPIVTNPNLINNSIEPDNNLSNENNTIKQINIEQKSSNDAETQMENYSKIQINPIEKPSNEPQVSVMQQPVNPVLQQFTINNTEPNIQSNSVITEANTPNITNSQPLPNPTLQEFNNASVEVPFVTQSQQGFNTPLSSINEVPNPNPVLQHFNSTQPNNSIFNTSNTTGDTDIFGQPINK